MIEKTTNLGLNKPVGEANFNIKHFNDNADIIDAEISSLNEKVDAETERVNEELSKKADITYVNEEIEEKTNEVTKTANNSFTNAIKGEASGAVVRVDDVSPVEHELEVKVKSTNIIPLALDWTEKEINGTTFKVNDDKSINVSGTPSTNASTQLCSFSAEPYIGKNVVIPQTSTSVYFSIHLQYNDGTDTTYGWLRSDKSTALTATIPKNADKLIVNIVVTTSFDVSEITAYPQINVGTEVKEYTPYVDPSTVKVTICGKNLIPYPYSETTKTVNGITFTDNGNGTITVNGTATADALMSLCTIQNPIPFPAGTYTISSGVSNDDAAKTYGITVGVKIDDNRGTQYSKNGYNTFTLDKNADIDFILTVRSGQTVTNLTFYPQFEFGGTADTEYEQYVESAECTPNTDGTVEGVTSLYPAMTLLTDKAGVSIELEYNKDTNKVIESLINAIISLGGNI